MENSFTTGSTTDVLKNTSIAFVTDGVQNYTEVPANIPTNDVHCPIDPQLAFIVAISSGGLIIALLISTLVLSCKVIDLKRQCQARRPTRSNVDLVSGAGYWGTETIEGGIVGPCETNLLLEEVRTDAENEEVHDGAEEPILHYSPTTNTDVESAPVTMQTSTSRDSCIDPKELENMPLMFSGGTTYEEYVMRTILFVCVMVLLLPRKLNSTITLSPSTFSKHEDTSGTPELKPKDDVFSSKWPSHVTGASSAEHKNTEMRMPKDESASHSPPLAILAGQTSFNYSSQHGLTTEGHGTSSRIPGSTATSAKKRDEDTTRLIPENIASKMHSQVTKDQGATGLGHTENKTTEAQLTRGESESPSHLSSITSSKGQRKRSMDHSHNNQTTSTPTMQNTLRSQEHRNTTKDEHQTSNTFKSTDRVSVTVNQQPFSSRSTEKSFNPATNQAHLQTTEVNTFGPKTVPAVPQTNPQTTKQPTEARENEGTNATIPQTVRYTTNSNTNSVTVRKSQTNDTAPAINTSTTEVTITNSSKTTSGSSTGLIPTNTTKTATSATTDKKTAKIATRGTTTSRTTLMATFTTQPGKTQSTEKNIRPKDPDKEKEKKKNGNAGPYVAALIGTALLLMFLAINAIVIRNRRMQKKKMENSDWAGPSPFLESDTQTEMRSHGEDGLFRRDTKRISLHSFLPQRLSQRLSLLVEEEVQMNDIAGGSTFGKNEQPQNGKPAGQQDPTEAHITDNEIPATEAPTEPAVPEMLTVSTASVDNQSVEDEDCSVSKNDRLSKAKGCRQAE
ncbi:hypothetical protein NFI96_008471 [Prochilodus magdalenae]|nr:hypothetical protein NFI96_008471 [Prochilodus magdalenae]